MIVGMLECYDSYDQYNYYDIPSSKLTLRPWHRGWKISGFH